MNKLFSGEPVNTGRQFEIDMAKAVCILGMVIVHCFEELSGEAAATSGLYYVFVTVLDALFGAGTFMACMGLGIAYSRRTTADFLLRRGFTLFVTGYGLNLLRNGLQMAFWAAMGHIGWISVLCSSLYMDILPFAGLALMLFGLLKKAKLSDLGILAVAVGMSALGSFVRNFPVENPLLFSLVGLFFGDLPGEGINEAYCSCFPLFNWFLFVAAGNCLGQLLLRCRDKKHLYAIAAPAAAAAVVLYIAITAPRGWGMMGEDINLYYHLTTPEVILCLCGTVTVLGLYDALSHILPEKGKALISRISGDINEVYCVHWLLIGNLAIGYWFSAAGRTGFSTGMVILTALIVFSVSVWLGHRYGQWKKNRRKAA